MILQLTPLTLHPKSGKISLRCFFFLLKIVFHPIDNNGEIFYHSFFVFFIWMQGHRKAKTLRMSPLVFPDLCTALFEGASATGIFNGHLAQTI